MLRLPLVLLLALPLSAQLPTVALPEQAVSAPHFGPIDGGSPAAIAAGASNFLIVSIKVYHFYASEHWAMLVDEHGAPLLDESIALPVDGGFFSAATAWSGREYLVVLGSYGASTLAVRIDANGKLLDAQPIKVREGNDFLGTTSRVVAWDGTQFVVATPAATTGAFVATRVSEAGEVLQTDIAITGANTYGLAVAAGHGKTLFLWNTTDGSGTQMRIMDSDGTLSPPRPAAGTNIVAVSDGFVAWSRSGDGLLLQHLDTDAQIDRPAVTVPVPSASLAGLQRSGDALLLLYRTTETGPLEAARVSTSGNFLEPSHDVLSPDEARLFPLVASTGPAAVATWATFGNAAYAPSITYAKALDVASAPNQVHRAAAAQSNGYVAFRGNDLAVAWYEGGLHTTIGGRPWRTDGGAPVAIASGPQATLVVSESDALIALAENHAAVQLDGKYIDSRLVRAVWTGKDFIVVWVSGANVMGARFDATGELVNGPTIVATGTGTSIDAIAIGASSSKILVVYHDQYVVRGVLLDDVGAKPTDDLTTRDDNQNLTSGFSVASDGTNFFVTWIDHGFNEVNDWIAGRLIDANGHALTKLSGYSTGSNYKNTAATFWNGSNYVAIWSQQSHLYAARVAPDGSLLDYPPVSLGTVNGVVTSYAEAPGGQIVVAYQRNARVFTTTLVPGRQRAATH